MYAIKLEELAHKLEAKLYGDGNIVIHRIASMPVAKKGDITFLSNSRYRDQLGQCQADAIILREEDLAYCSIAALVVSDPYLAYAKLAQILDTTPRPSTQIAPSAVIAEDAKLARWVSIGANTVIESGVELAENVTIGAGCFIGKDSKIGAGSKLWANVTIYHNVHIGADCLIQSGAVIGADGFGYANERGRWIKIPQLGGVRIGNRVEIGACTAIDRGALDDTIIEDGVIIDNLCQIAHNVIIGENTAVAGGVIMAGSLEIGRNCQIGGASVINGHMKIGDQVIVTGMGMVMRPINKPGIYSSGIPLQPNKEWRKTAALVMDIDKMNKRLKAVENQIKKQDVESKS